MGKKPEQNREPDADRKISMAFAECFKTPSGLIVLDYLRASFVNTAMGPLDEGKRERTDKELWFREGQRSIVGIIDVRMKEAEHEPVERPARRTRR